MQAHGSSAQSSLCGVHAVDDALCAADRPAHHQAKPQHVPHLHVEVKSGCTNVGVVVIRICSSAVRGT